MAKFVKRRRYDWAVLPMKQHATPIAGLLLFELAGLDYFSVALRNVISFVQDFLSTPAS